MKKMMNFGLCWMLLACAAFGESATLVHKSDTSEKQEGTRFTLAILPFENPTGDESHSEDLRDARKQLLQTLYDKGVVRVIEIDRIEALIGEKTGDAESYLKAVKTLQADTVLSVILKDVASEQKWLGRKRTVVELEAHWNGLSTGEILYMGSVSGSSSGKGDGDSAKKERFRSALDKALHSLVKELSRKAKAA